MKLNYPTALVAAWVLCLGSGRGILAADQEVEQLKDKVKALEGKVAELEKGKAPAGAPAPAKTPAGEASREALNDQSGAAPGPDQGPPAGEAEPGAGETPKIPEGRASEVKSRHTFNDEQEAAPRPDDLILDPRYVGFIPVPRTPVLLKFNAKPRVDFTWDPQNTGDNTSFITAKIPVEGSPDHGGGSVFNINAKGSRLSIDVRAPQVAGTPRFYFENDFFGSGSSEFNFRVRHVYGQIFNIIIGQTYSVFEDPDAWPDTVDFQGPNSQLSRRHPLVRYQLPLSKEWYLNFGIEQPGSSPADFFDPAIGPAGTTATVSGANHAPDGGWNARWERSGVGHAQFSTILRDVSTKTFTTPAGQEVDQDSVFGWGVNLSGGFQVFERDSLQSQVTVGQGIGSYGNDTSVFNKTDAAIDENGGLAALPYVGVMLGYTHWWEEQWRSSVSYGFVQMKPEESQGPNAYDTTHYLSVNLVYQIRKRLSTGLEGLYGVNRVQSGDDGDAWRVQVGLIYKLFD